MGASLAAGQTSMTEEQALTGGYYWFPTPSIGSVTWQVLTCHELGCDADVGHVDLWTLVIDRLATTWRRDRRLLRRSVTNHGHRPWHEEGPPEGAVYVR